MINELKPRTQIDHKRLRKAYALFGRLLSELRKKELPEDLVRDINRDIDKLNAIPVADKDFKKQLMRTQATLLDHLEKELKIVTKNNYRNRWTGIGIALGVPFGVAFGTALGNMAFIGIGIPIGLAIGVGIGTDMDKKAAKEGRQLDIEIEV